MVFHKGLLAAAGIVGAFAFAQSGPAASNDKTIAFGDVVTNTKNGVCFIGILGEPDAEGRRHKLEFGLRASDGNLGVVLKEGNMSFVSGQDTEANIPVTLILDGDRRTTSRSGGYTSGFRNRVWSGWGADPSAVPMRMLKAGSETASISFDGKTFGPFDLKRKWLVGNYLNSCMARCKADPASCK